MAKTFTVRFQRYSKNYAVYVCTDGVIANIYLPKHELGVNPPAELVVQVLDTKTAIEKCVIEGLVG